MRIGSLFSGVGGLDMAVETVFGGTVAWHSEVNLAASKVLAHKWPDVPNLGDITTIDWARIEPVDIICGGWPCQPFSLAGKRKGADDERALWPEVARAIRMVRPRIVVLENVSAVLGPEFSRVADSLAEIGYCVRWTCLRASDVGAPHRRERLFIIAHAADTPRDGWHEGRPAPTGLIGRSDAAQRGDGPVDLMPMPTAGDGQGGGKRVGVTWAGTTRSTGDGGASRLRDVVALLPTPNAQDGNGGGRYSSAGHQSTLPGEVRLLPTPRTTDAHGAGAHGTGGQDLRTTVTTAAWGKYAPAIHRWEQLTRPALAPTEPNKNGNPRLSAAFAEWMMGWPAGWCTDPAIGIGRNDQLRCIGNGVVPQQAMAALQWLLSIEAVAS